jgi:hypothetical protein
MANSNIPPRIIKWSASLMLCFFVCVGCTPASTPPPSEAPQPTFTQATTKPTINIPTPTLTIMVPTPTVQPTEIQATTTNDVQIEYAVPPGTEAVIDGVLSMDEWDAALAIDLDGESQLFLMHAGGYLYLGIQGKAEPVISICIDQKDQVSILHSSAAIGTAIYQPRDGIWERVKDFEWCCRETADSPRAQEALSQHLEQAGWVANNGLRGVPEEVEFQIAMPSDSLRLAVNAIGPPSYRSVLSWPDGLKDDCSRLSMLTGPIPEQAQFSQADWVKLSILQE